MLLASAGTAFLGGCAGMRDNITDFNTVVIDAGHGGHDTGAFTRNYTTRRVRVGKRVRTRVVSTGPRYLEKNLALDVAQRIEPKLKAAGFRTVMTRRSDVFIPLDGRVKIGNSYRKSVFLSVHFNDARRRYSSGVEVFHNRIGTWQLAERIEDSLAAMPGSIGRGVKTANFRVLRCATGPSLLVECGFLSNATEAARCANPVWREEVSRRIANAVIAQRQTGPFGARRVPRETPPDTAAQSVVGDPATTVTTTPAGTVIKTTGIEGVTEVVVSSTSVTTTTIPATRTAAEKPAKPAKATKAAQPTAVAATSASATAETAAEKPAKKGIWSFFKKRTVESAAEGDAAPTKPAAPTKKSAEDETVTPVLPKTAPTSGGISSNAAGTAPRTSTGSPKKSATKRTTTGTKKKSTGKSKTKKKARKKAARSSQE